MSSAARPSSVICDASWKHERFRKKEARRKTERSKRRPSSGYGCTCSLAQKREEKSRYEVRICRAGSRGGEERLPIMKKRRWKQRGTRDIMWMYAAGARKYGQAWAESAYTLLSKVVVFVIGATPPLLILEEKQLKLALLAQESERSRSHLLTRMSMNQK